MSRRNRVTVVGGQGFIGRYLIAALNGPEIVASALGRSPYQPDSFTHRLRCGGRERSASLPFDGSSLSPSLYMRADIRDVDATASALSRLSPDVVVHLGGELRPSPDAAQDETNVTGTATLLSALEASGVRPQRIVLGSSCAVYGSSDLRLPLTESSPTDPSSAYALSKLEAERIVSAYCNTRGIELSIARIFNVLGPGQDDGHFPGRLASQITAIANGWSEPVLEFGDLSPTRDFVDVRDTARALAHLALSNSAPTVANICGGVETGLEQLLNIALDQVRPGGNVKTVRERGRSPGAMRHVGSFDLLASGGFVLRHTVKESFGDLLSYYEDSFPLEEPDERVSH